MAQIQDKTFIEHLEDLRWHIIRPLVVLAVICAALYPAAGYLLSLLSRPVGRLTFISPAEAFAVHLMVVFFAGLSLTAPYILFQGWRFASSGLTDTERRYSIVFLPVGVFCFAAGCAFGYAVILPVAMDFFLSFASPGLVPMITAGKYVSFAGSLIFCFGLVFEMPVVITFLSKIGIATPDFLIQKRRYAVVAIFVASALITPPDCITQIMMALPLLILYELSILCSRWVFRLRQDQDEGTHA